jgi:hypothetical protein
VGVTSPASTPSPTPVVIASHGAATITLPNNQVVKVTALSRVRGGSSDKNYYQPAGLWLSNGMTYYFDDMTSFQVTAVDKDAGGYSVKRIAVSIALRSGGTVNGDIYTDDISGAYIQGQSEFGPFALLIKEVKQVEFQAPAAPVASPPPPPNLIASQGAAKITLPNGDVVKVNSLSCVAHYYSSSNEYRPAGIQLASGPNIMFDKMLSFEVTVEKDERDNVKRVSVRITAPTTGAVLDGDIDNYSCFLEGLSAAGPFSLRISEVKRVDMER